MNCAMEFLSFLGLGLAVFMVLAGLTLIVRDTFRFVKKLFALARRKKET